MLVPEMSHKRRVARLVGSILSMIGGIVFASYIPGDTIWAILSVWTVRSWGACFFVGGLLSMVGWFKRVLILDRAGVTLIITGLVGLLYAQIAGIISRPLSASFVNIGFAVVIAMGVALLVARWQDIRRDEEEAIRVIRQTWDVLGAEGDRRSV